nr:hypothetical protein [Tanacetum cinerariifolium]
VQVGSSQLGVEQRRRQAAGQAQQNFQILTAGVNHFDDVSVFQQRSQRFPVIDQQRIDQVGARAIANLQKRGNGIEGVDPHEFGVERDKRQRLPLCAMLGEAVVGTSRRPLIGSLALFTQHINAPHGVTRQEVVITDNAESGLRKLRLNVGTADHKAIAHGRRPARIQTTALLALATPGLEVAIDPQRHNRGIAGHAVEFLENRHPLLAVGDVMKQPHAKDAIHGVGRQADGKRRTLKGADALADVRG